MDLCKKVASEWNNSVAQWLIGLLYVEGDENIPVDIEAGAHWISLAIKRGWPYAFPVMREIIRFGVSDKVVDKKKIITRLETFAKKDKIIKDETFYLFGNKKFVVDFSRVNQKVMILLEERWLNEGANSPLRALRDVTVSAPQFKDHQRILIWNLLAVKESSGVLACQLSLSLLYFNGEGGVPKDFTKALYWTKMAAKNKSANACTYLGSFYKNGTGTKQDYHEAIKWYRKGYAMGSSESAFHLGLMHYKAMGVKRDCKLALNFLKLFSLDEDNGLKVLTFYCMGEIHLRGWDGVPQDYKAAYVCYEEAFELGFDMGALKIAGLYCRGLGVKKDQAKTIEWLHKAVSRGCLISPNLLSTINLNGFKTAEPFIVAQLNASLDLNWVS